MTKKVIVYIDGENFLHRIEDSLKKAKIIKKKEDILHFPVRGMLERIFQDLQIDEIRYYGTKIRTYDIKQKEVLEHANKMVESQRRFKRNLTNQGIDFIVAGSLRVRENTCYHCKKTGMIFKEKGVDVRLATDLLSESGKGTVQIVVSSDSDLLPALKRSKDLKSRLIYLHHAEQPNYAMIKVSHESRVFTHNQIVKSYKEDK